MSPSESPPEPPPAHARLKRLERALVAANRAVLGALMIAMFGLVFANVVSRYGLGHSIAWAEEVSRYLMIWATFLGAGLALREGRHVAIDILQDRLPPRAVRWVRRFIAGFLLAFVGLLGVYGVQFAAFGWAQETPVTQIPMGIPYLAVPAGALLLGLHLVLMLPAFVARSWELDEDAGEGAAGLGGE